MASHLQIRALAGRAFAAAELPVLASTTVAVALALNLRPSITGVGAVMPDIVATPGVTVSLGAILAALPPLCLSLGSLLMPVLQARRGATDVVTVALVTIVLGCATRLLTAPVPLVLGTALVCGGVGVLGAAGPMLIRGQHDLLARTRLSSVWGVALGGGSTAGALITPMVTNHSHWQVGLLVWAGLAAATITAWRWLPHRLVPPELDIRRTARPGPRRHVANNSQTRGPAWPLRSATAWALVGHFGCVSVVSFTALSWLPTLLAPAPDASWMFAAAMLAGLPSMAAAPRLADARTRRGRGHSGLVVLFALPGLVGVLGLRFAPHSVPWVWSILLGIGLGSIGLALHLITARAGSATATAPLSGMTQGIGYLVATGGVWVCGQLHVISHGWNTPLTFLAIVIGGQMVSGALAGRPVVIHERTTPSPRPDTGNHATTRQATHRSRHQLRTRQFPWPGSHSTSQHKEPR